MRLLLWIKWKYASNKSHKKLWHNQRLSAVKLKRIKCKSFAIIAKRIKSETKRIKTANNDEKSQKYNVASNWEIRKQKKKKKNPNKKEVEEL